MTDCTRQVTEPLAGEPPAWATDTAEKILYDAAAYRRDDALAVITARLRVIHEQGIAVGIDRAAEALRS